MKLVIILRVFLGLALLFMGVHGIYNVESNKSRISETIERFEFIALAEWSINMNLKLLKEHPLEIVYFQSIILIYGGFLSMFGFGIAKGYITASFLLQFLLSYNLYFYNDDGTIKRNSVLLAILGGILTSI
jgi:hypothetical protein